MDQKENTHTEAWDSKTVRGSNQKMESPTEVGPPPHVDQGQKPDPEYEMELGFSIHKRRLKKLLQLWGSN